MSLSLSHCLLLFLFIFFFLYLCVCIYIYTCLTCNSFKISYFAYCHLESYNSVFYFVSVTVFVLRMREQ